MADQVTPASSSASTGRSPIPSSVLSKNASFDSGQFTIAGITATKIAEEFQTPLFVIDEEDFFTRAATFKDALESAAGANAGHCYYAGKAFLCKEVVKWVEKAGLSLDVCTGGELEVALAAGFPTSRIEFHGNNKSVAEIRRAISVGIDLIIVDSEIELEASGRPIIDIIYFSGIDKVIVEFDLVGKEWLKVWPVNQLPLRFINFSENHGFTQAGY